ncbi:MAG: class I SAM-dependent methyltransferase [Nanoarchaeota archaeon]
MINKLKGILEEDLNFFIRKTQIRLSTKEIKKLGDNLVGVEIGVDKGKNAKFLLKELSLKKLYLVDMIKKVTFKDNRVTFIQKTSDDSARIIPNDLDFVYIDGDHSYKQVKKDIGNYYPKIRKGGILAGHDINQSGVFKAVSEFAVENRLNVEVDFQDWVIQKPK